MSYEGYERVLCRNGHLDEDDCYSAGFTLPEWRCSICGEPSCWWESVDQTNDAGTQTHLVVYRKQTCRCVECGDQHTTGPVQYCIPGTPDHQDPSIAKATQTPPLVPMVRCGVTVLETGEHFDDWETAVKRQDELWEERDQQHRQQLKDLGLDQ